MSNTVRVSGPIVFKEQGLQPENYFMESTGGLIGLPTHKLEPDDLRRLADHLEHTRALEAQKNKRSCA